jgi:hypothetical protein
MKQSLLTLFLMLSVLSGGCTPAAPAQTVEPGPAAAAENGQPTAAIPTATQPPTPTPPPSATPEPPPTETPVPTETVEPSPTATEQAMAEFRFTGSVRQMPDADAAMVASFSQGIRLRAIHQDPSGQWYYVQIAPFSYGWVYQDEVTGSGLADLAQATPDVTPTPEAQASGGRKCFLTMIYTVAGKPKNFEMYLQGFNPLDNYVYKLINPKGTVMGAYQIKARADGTFFREISGDGSLGTYTLEIYFVGQLVTSCKAEVVQK